MNEKQRKSPFILKIILPILIIILGVGGVKFMGGLKKEPPRQKPEQQGILVDVMKLRLIDHQVSVEAVGTVTADREISLTTQVSGKVVWMSPQLVPGGFFTAGETLFKIEADDYLLAVEQAGAEVAQAEVALAKEQEQSRIAQAEWERIDLPDKGNPGPLVTREIQLRQQQAILAAARAGLRKAQLNLRRTVIKAPFNGRVREENIDLGQYLVSGSSIGLFAGTDRAEIAVSLPISELRWLTIPGPTQKSGSSVDIYLPSGRKFSRQGKVIRSLGEIDTTSRTATVVVSVDDPYHLNSHEKQATLPHGQFVKVVLKGQILKDVIAVPRDALHPGDTLWLVDESSRLKQIKADLIYREKDQLIIGNSQIDGAQLILTNLSGASDGTLLRIIKRESQQ